MILMLSGSQEKILHDKTTIVLDSVSSSIDFQSLSYPGQIYCEPISPPSNRKM